MSNAKKMIIAAAIGAAAGALAGILYAPAAGRDTRKKCKKAGRRLKAAIDGTIRKCKSQLDIFSDREDHPNKMQKV